MKINDLYDLVMQNILHHLDEGIHAIDSEGITIMYNESMAQLEGIESENVINKKLLEIFPSLDENSSTLLTVLNTGTSILNRVQTYLNYKGEKVTTVNTTIPLIKNREKVGALEIAKDITKIKMLSEQIIDLQQELVSKKCNVDKKNTIKKYTFNNIIGSSNELLKSIDKAKRASMSSSSVLIYGETGTGKELFAQSMHYSGVRKNNPFVAQNCAALPETLLEGILFGTVKGSFTGALDRPGLFEQADGGTLLLDEINSMGISLQSKLLRVLQEGYIRRVGGSKDIPIDVRIIATTNEPPLDLVKNNLLRKDLYYRLCVLNIDIPPLKKRFGDIGLLSNYFINKYNERLCKDVYMISNEVIDIFRKYDWPGNVRELENIIEGAMNLILDTEHIITEEHLPGYINEYKNKDVFSDIDIDNSLMELLSNIEQKIIMSKLIETDFNISKAAQKLNIKRQTLQHKIKKYNIST